MAAMSCPTRISEELADFDADGLIRHLQDARQTSLGENADIGIDEVRMILQKAA
jgi:hypothetical protein